MAYRNPFASVPRGRYNSFKSSRLSDRLRKRSAQRDAERVAQALTLKYEQAEQKRAANVGNPNILERIGEGIDEFPIIGALKQGGGSFLGGALDVLSRPASAVSGGVIGAMDAADEGRDVGEGLASGIRTGLFGTEEERVDLNFATALEKAGVENPIARNVVGFALDVVTDPLNLLALGPATRALRSGTRALGRQSLRIPGMVNIADSFSPVIGDIPISQIRRTIKRLGGTDADVDEFAQKARQLRNLSRGQAWEQAVQEVTTAFGRLNASDEEIRNAGRTLIEYAHPKATGRVERDPVTGIWRPEMERATWDEAMEAVAEGGEREVIRQFKHWFNYDPVNKEYGTIANLVKDALDGNMVTGPYIRTLWKTDKRNLGKVGVNTATPDFAKAQTVSRQNILQELQKPDSQIIDDIYVVAAHDIAQKRLLGAQHELLKQVQKWKVDGEDVFRVMDASKAAEIGYKKWQPPRFLWTEELDKLDEIDAGQWPKSKGIIEDRLKKGDIYGPEEVVRALDTMQNPRKVAGLTRMVDTFHSLWKPFQTTFTLGGLPVFPAFYVRNAIGLVFNNGLMDASMLTNPKPYLDAMKDVKSVMLPSKRAAAGAGDDFVVNLSQEAQQKLAQQGRDITGTLADGQLRMKREDAMRLIEEMGGINTGGWFGVGQQQVVPEGRVARLRQKVFGEEIVTEETQRKMNTMELMKQQLDDYGKQLARREGPLGLGLGVDWQNILHPFKAGRTYNEAMDNVAKLAHIRVRIGKHGDTLEEAVESARKYLFDYTDVSPTVENLSKLIPFFRWSRFNVPLQLENLLAQPYKASKVGLIKNAIGGAAADINQVDESLTAEAVTLPDWVVERLHIVTGRNDDGSLAVVSGFGLPIEDLNKMFSLNKSNTIQNWAAEMTPVLRVPLELASNNSFFTGEDLTDRSLGNYYARAWQWTDKVPGLRDWLGIRKDEKNGRTYYRSDKPLNNYIFASIVGRLGVSVDKGMKVFGEPRQLGEGINLLTGFKYHPTAWPQRPESGDWDQRLEQRLATNPELAPLYDAYRQIPLYTNLAADPEANREASELASKAITSINRLRNSLAIEHPEADKDKLWQVAAGYYGERVNAKGAALAILIKKGGIKQSGRKIRAAFKAQNPDLARLLSPVSTDFADGLSTYALSILEGEDPA